MEYSRIPAYPQNMLIESTNVCNHRCVFCANRFMTREKRFIDTDLAKDILRQAYALGTRQVGFYTVGEPLLHKDLSVMVAEAKSLGYTYIYTDTNGALASMETLAPILAAGLDSIKFSINAGTRASYQRIHGRDDFDTVIHNLLTLSEYRRVNHMHFRLLVSFIVTQITQGEAEDFKTRIGPYVDEIRVIPVGLQGGQMIGRLEGGILLPNSKHLCTCPCQMVFDRFHITADGYLTACCVDFNNDLVMADLHEVSLADGWRSEAFQTLREKHISDQLEGTQCYKCIHG